MRYLLAIVLLGTQLVACTNRQIYESVNTSQKNECDLLQGVQREECLKHLPPTYTEYERERQKLKKQ
jgi:hypothetical protein